jgi:hypothetical protein
MPEQISKYPEVTLKVLKGAGARCGEGADQQILKKCPHERFCSLPTGEICIYGIDEIPQMTQITLQDLARVVCPAEQQASTSSGVFSGVDLLLLGAGLCVGIVVGRVKRNFGKR